MTQLKQNAIGDVDVTNNKFSVTENNSDEEIIQRLRQGLKTFLNEWFLDLSIGLPYFQIILVKGTQPSIIEALIKNKIIETRGISTITRFEDIDLNTRTRKLTVDFDITTINGNPVTINEGI